jgi:hypothetical protein
MTMDDLVPRSFSRGELPIYTKLSPPTLPTYLRQ